MSAGMREHRAQIVLTVRAFEEADRQGLILPWSVRSAATQRAAAVTGMSDMDERQVRVRAVGAGETVFRRARLLFEVLVRRFPVLRRIGERARKGSGLGPAVLFGAPLFGALLNFVEPARALSLTWLPLLLLLAWNLARYAMLLAGPLVRRSPPPGEGAGLPSRLARLFVRWTLARSLKLWVRLDQATPQESKIVTDALRRLAAMWHRLTAPLLEQRARVLMHAVAILIVLGALGGMYLKAATFGFLVVRGGSLLEGAARQGLIDALLAPAAFVLGVDVPSLPPVHGAAAGEGAALWFHLYGTTALIVLLPRLALLQLARWRDRRLSRALPVDLDDGYFRRLFSEWRGRGRRVDVFTCAVSPGAANAERLLSIIHEFYGARAGVYLHSEDERDETPEPDAGVAADRRYRVALFDMGQVPDPRRHGLFLEQMLQDTRNELGELLVLLDRSNYRGAAPNLAAWESMVSGAGLTAVPIDLDRPPRDALFDAMRDAAWSADGARGAEP